MMCYVQSHVINYFEKYVTISWDCDTLFGDQILEEKFGKTLAFLKL
jgi:hypothetical protein